MLVVAVVMVAPGAGVRLVTVGGVVSVPEVEAPRLSRYI